MRFPVNHALPLAALIMLNGCLGGSGSKVEAVPLPTNGPSADYPMVLGDSFNIGGETYTPVDRMNYDAVGRATFNDDGGNSVTAAHKTLPLPSYVEVTALDSGKTILVRVERRGPMTNERLVTLSPGAAAQLGLSGADGAPVRVRRVNPPEQERAMLRGGGRVPDRMDTPKSLAAVLLRKLDGGAAKSPIMAPTPAPTARPAPAGPKAKPVPRASNTAPAVEKPAPAAATEPAERGGYFVQVGAFSNKESADSLATSVGGRVVSSGRIHRVRMGPYRSQRAADAALAKAKSAGYSDARIQRVN